MKKQDSTGKEIKKGKGGGEKGKQKFCFWISAGGSSENERQVQGSLIRNCPPVKKNFLFLVSGHNWLGAKTKTIFEREAKIETRKDFRDLGKYLTGEDILTKRRAKIEERVKEKEKKFYSVKVCWRVF